MMEGLGERVRLRFQRREVSINESIRNGNRDKEVRSGL